MILTGQYSFLLATTDWHAAVYSSVLPSLAVLDLRAHAATLTDERLLPMLMACPQLKEVSDSTADTTCLH